MSETSLVFMSRAAEMLIKATTLQKARELKDMALTAAYWAKQKGMSADTVQYAKEYSWRAQRRMGEIYREQKKAKGGEQHHKNPTGNVVTPVVATLADLKISKRESSDAQKMAKLSEDKFEGAIVAAKNKPDLLKIISGAHVSHNSGENEWFTPLEYIKAAQIVLGSIDTDPASNKIANKTVNAKTFYTEKNDGLKQKWAGNVWMNPPYSQPLIKQFCDSVSEKYDTGEIKQACVLVNNATETKHFQRMLKSASAVCFPKERVKFIDTDGNSTGTPLQGQAVLYFGKNAKEFCLTFKKFGEVLVIWKKEE